MRCKVEGGWQLGFVDGDDGRGTDVGVGRQRQSSLDFACLDGALPVHRARELLLQCQCERSGRCGGRRRHGGVEIERVSGRPLSAHGEQVVFGRHGSHEVSLLSCRAASAELHAALRQHLRRHRGWRGLLKGGVRVELLLRLGGTVHLRVELVHEARICLRRTAAAESFHSAGHRTGSSSLPEGVLDLLVLKRLRLLLHLHLGGQLLLLLLGDRDLFLVGVHDEIVADGGEGGILLVATGRQNFVKGKNEVKGAVADDMFLQAPRNVRHHLGQESERPQILHDVGGLCGYQKQVEVVLQRLVDVSDGVCFYECVLLGMPDELGKGRQQSLHAQAIHLHKLPREQGLPLPCAYRSR
mmetsp:Transcript_1328/g.3244  ORF Transcript_1328/g.3244 Transcript_1328/m.3244 type:complete len:355 (-) Transcript_1328:160-1224(-)